MPVRGSRFLGVLLVLGLAAASLPVFAPPAAAAGRFIDDDGNVHEGFIEAIAAAGITGGCNPPDFDRYCPSDSVTRGEMAAFLRRALGLGAADGDYFSDDENSIFQDDINRLATAGITSGCAPDLYCPGSDVRRDQMASFLGRALGLEPLPPGPPPGPFACTEVIGFSQSGQWFDSFTVPGWQARIQGGANIEKWTNPDFTGWNAAVRDRQCSRSEVDRVLLTISGGGRPAESWADDISTVIGVIRSKYPAVETIMLQPVVGGPGHAECPFGDNTVRASRNHPVIDQGIALVVAAEDSSVVAGASPEVSTCSHYGDQLGHLTTAGSQQVGADLSAFYG